MGILRSIFGGSSKSYNKAAPWINDTFKPAAQTGLGGLTQLGNELSGGFDSYKQNSGYNFGLNEGMDGITGNAAAHGLLRSGSTGKALERYGADYFKNRYYDDYLGNLGSLAGLGLGAGGLVANANEVNRGGSSGILGNIGSALGLGSLLFGKKK